eukprot:scaffold693_cov399-Prasinococcus_capsulatus_cf.AAC.22
MVILQVVVPLQLPHTVAASTNRSNEQGHVTATATPVTALEMAHMPDAVAVGDGLQDFPLLHRHVANLLLCVAAGGATEGSSATALAATSPKVVPAAPRRWRRLRRPTSGSWRLRSGHPSGCGSSRGGRGSEDESHWGHLLTTSMGVASATC